MKFLVSSCNASLSIMEKKANTVHSRALIIQEPDTHSLRLSLICNYIFLNYSQNCISPAVDILLYFMANQGDIMLTFYKFMGT